MGRRWVRGLALGSALLACTLPALAQKVALDPSAAVRCLRLTEGALLEPEYPFDAWKQGQSGRVLVSLSFTAPDKGPDVTVQSQEGDTDFVRAVRAHVAQLRVPCLQGAAGEQVQLQQSYVFQPDQRRVYWSEPVDTQDGRRWMQLRCLSHLSGGKTPDYPSSALRRAISGRVLAQLSFSAPDRAPSAQVFSRPDHRILAQEIERWVQQYRMPCFEGPRPIEATFEFVFKFEGAEAVGFKPLTFMQLLPHIRGIQQQTLKFDTTQMSCPFDLKFQYRQPDLPNLVGEVGDLQPARRQLLAWLSAQELALPARSLDTIYGDSTIVSVPCVKLDIQPKENK